MSVPSSPKGEAENPAELLHGRKAGAVTLGHLCFWVLVLSNVSRVNNKSPNRPTSQGARHRAIPRRRSGLTECLAYGVGVGNAVFQPQAVFQGTRKPSQQCPERSRVHELCTVCGMILLCFRIYRQRSGTEGGRKHWSPRAFSPVELEGFSLTCSCLTNVPSIYSETLTPINSSARLCGR